MGSEIKPVNAGKPWTEEDITLVASYVPTWNNASILAKLLGRTPHAIQYLWCKLYMKTTDLKNWAQVDTSSSEQASKILNVRRNLQLCIGK